MVRQRSLRESVRGESESAGNACIARHIEKKISDEKEKEGG